ncbi:MAG: type II secretion system protein [Candidatus Pacebacteria bacterium]|nr:type II secretion system protein [Candidatus Paceibacterota bacterium]
MHTNTQKGFTLIELLVVISIIGLLSSVVLVSLQGARDKALKARILQATGQARNALELTRTTMGYSGLQSSGDGFAFYGNLSADLKAVVDDILKQQGTDAATGYVGGAGNCASGNLNPSLTSAGVAITTNATACGSIPTDYAIYSALKPIGTGGFICQDAKGGKYTATTGGIVLNEDAGACEGTVASGNNEPGASVTTSLSFTGADGPYHSFDLTWTSSGTITGCGYWITTNPSGYVEEVEPGSYDSGLNQTSAIPINIPSALFDADGGNGSVTVSVGCNSSSGMVSDSVSWQP